MAQAHRPPARSVFGSLVLIAVVVGGGAAVFAYTAGWFSPQRLTPDKMVDALTPATGEPLGHRRNLPRASALPGCSKRMGRGRRFHMRRSSPAVSIPSSDV